MTRTETVGMIGGARKDPSAHRASHGLDDPTPEARFTPDSRFLERRDSLMQEALDAGETVSAVALRFGVSASQVYRRTEGPAGRVGRPHRTESARRAREFLRLVAGGRTVVAALKEAQVSPKRFAKLIEVPEFRGALQAILDQKDAA